MPRRSASVVSSPASGLPRPECGFTMSKPFKAAKYGTQGSANEPFGPWCCPGRVPIFTAMSERGLHRIEDDLSDTWLEDWAGAGVAEIEALLAKHAAFLSFLDSQES